MSENQTWEEARGELLSNDPELRDSYDAIQPAYVLAREVSRWRKDRGLSQKQLAELAGTTQAQISKIERMESSPTLDTAFRLARALGCEADLRFVPNIQIVDVVVGQVPEDLVFVWSPETQTGRVNIPLGRHTPRERIAEALEELAHILARGHESATRGTPEHHNASDR